MVDVEPLSPTAPVLRRPVLMNQDWRDLTFLHWAVEPERVTPLMPPGVRPDVHDRRDVRRSGAVPDGRRRARPAFQGAVAGELP